MKTHRIAVIPGDGIGKEVVPEGIRVLDAVAVRHGIRLEWNTFDWSCETYARTGRMMPEDGLDRLRPHDAIFLGAVGYPGVPDHVSLWGLLIPIRRVFEQYVNLRPVRLMPGIASPLANRKPGDIEFWVVRENNEGEYSSIGGRIFEGTEHETVIQQNVFTRRGVDRILRYAFELARSRPKKHLTSATKSNGIVHTMPFWDERVEAMAKQYPDVRVDKFHVDILTAHFVQHPDWFDVVVGSNLFGDILSDLGPAVCGTIGIAPSANLNPERQHPVDVRAGPRLRARHRGQGHREPHRPDLVGRDDARAPRARGGRRRRPRRNRGAWCGMARARATSAVPRPRWRSERRSRPRSRSAGDVRSEALRGRGRALYSRS